MDFSSDWKKKKKKVLLIECILVCRKPDVQWKSILHSGVGTEIPVIDAEPLGT